MWHYTPRWVKLPGKLLLMRGGIGCDAFQNFVV